jgi:ABC-2 type transport system ATP-binding protein
MKTIEIKNLSKSFKDTNALDDVTLTFEENRIYGLLGRNGAGKSTLLNLISNRLFPDSGSVSVCGEPVLENDRVLDHIYCMSEQNLYPEGMRVDAAYQWSKDFYPNFDLDYAKSLSKKFGLRLNKKIKNLSTGYGSIFKLIVALSCNVSFVLLDEPVLGLDANHRDLFYRELVDAYANSPRTFIVSTHLIEEVAGIIEQVIIIKEGRVILNDSMENISTMGYCITGPAASVDSFTAGKKLLGEHTLGGLKAAYLWGEYNGEPLPQGLELSGLDLQKLFIELTNA